MLEVKERNLVLTLLWILIWSVLWPVSTLLPAEIIVIVTIILGWVNAIVVGKLMQVAFETTLWRYLGRIVITCLLVYAFGGIVLDLVCRTAQLKAFLDIITDGLNFCHGGKLQIDAAIFLLLLTMASTLAWGIFGTKIGEDRPKGR